MVGISVGMHVGISVGDSIGDNVVGTREMYIVGQTVGRILDGSAVGIAEGALDGFFVGLNVVGILVGDVPQNNVHTAFVHVAFGLQQSAVDLQP
jgi:hypothetical protein